MGVITKPSSVQRSGIVRLLVSCGMAAGCGGGCPQRAPRGAVYRRHGLLPRAPHARRLTQTVHKKRGLFRGSCACFPLSIVRLSLALVTGKGSQVYNRRTLRLSPRSRAANRVCSPDLGNMQVMMALPMHIVMRL